MNVKVDNMTPEEKEIIRQDYHIIDLIARKIKRICASLITFTKDRKVITPVTRSEYLKRIAQIRKFAEKIEHRKQTTYENILDKK